MPFRKFLVGDRFLSSGKKRFQGWGFWFPYRIPAGGCPRKSEIASIKEMGDLPDEMKAKIRQEVLGARRKVLEEREEQYQAALRKYEEEAAKAASTVPDEGPSTIAAFSPENPVRRTHASAPATVVGSGQQRK